MATVVELGETPLYFGAEGTTPQKTLITDEPLKVPFEDYQRIRSITEQVADYISQYPLLDRLDTVGIDPNFIREATCFDQTLANQMIYGGLDLYRDPEQGFKVLEINPLAQAMGLQDFRLEYLGIKDQPLIAQYLVDRLLDENHRRALVLGSKQNPFWRGHQRVASMLNDYGIETKHTDAQSFEELHKAGFDPDVVIRFTNSRFLLSDPKAQYLRELLAENQIPVYNSISSTAYGYRGFLRDVEVDLPGLLPDQTELTTGSNADTLERYPWIKLDAHDFSYVAHAMKIRRWGRDAILALVKGDDESFIQLLQGKVNSDSTNLWKAHKAVHSTSPDQIKWIAQQNVEPQEAILRVDGEPTTLKILHRAYWVTNIDGKIDISIEGFGCTPEQYSSSKAKINAGSGISVPMVIV